MKIIVAGGSGFIGRALISALSSSGHEVCPLVRREPQIPAEIPWEPSAGKIDLAAIANADAFINLAGENIAAGRWTRKQRKRILQSRIDATRTLVLAIAQLERKPRVFLSASAVGFYGERGDERLTETSGVGQGFLPEVCLAWETHAEGASRQGIRTALLRLGVVLGKDGGALAKMLPVFRLGLGGKLGAGNQWMSWISQADAVGAICHALEATNLVGPVNLVAPHPVRNGEFTRILAQTLGRLAFLTVPAAALRLMFGQMATETLLTSERVIPTRLIETGYAFQHPTLAAALRAAL
ncbi:MAG: hypothetical protein RIQ93_3204 [Verrucomicrobiota bacterium]